jgi:hypothetical protein
MNPEQLVLYYFANNHLKLSENIYRMGLSPITNSPQMPQNLEKLAICIPYLSAPVPGLSLVSNRHHQILMDTSATIVLEIALKPSNMAKNPEASLHHHLL